MCVVAFAYQTHPRWKLVLIGNRDEFHARPSAALDRWQGHDVLAGRDIEAGGTWMGVTDRGRCAVVTNVRDPLVQRKGARSRGELPAAYLMGNRGAREMTDALTRIAQDFLPFNLLLIDEDESVYLGNHPDVKCMRLEPGLYAMSNGSFDAPWPKALQLKSILSEWMEEGSDATESLWEKLRDCREFPTETLPQTGVGPDKELRLSPVFIHGADYGTRASTVIALDAMGRGWIAERRYGAAGLFMGETRLRIPLRR